MQERIRDADTNSASLKSELRSIGRIIRILRFPHFFDIVARRLGINFFEYRGKVVRVGKTDEVGNFFDGQVRRIE